MTARAISFKSRLGWSIAAAVFAAIVAIELIILIPSYNHRSEDLYRQLETIGFAQVVALLNASHGRTDPSNLDTALGGISKRSSLRGAAIYNPDGSLVAKIGEVPKMDIPVNYSGHIMRTKSGDGSRYDICWGPDHIGLPYIFVARLDSTGIGEELKAYTFRILLLILLIGGATTAILMLFLNRRVIGPILQLRSNLVAAGNDPMHPELYKLDFQRSDEIGEVAASFDRMVSQFSAMLAKLSRRENELKKSEMRFRRMFDASHDSIFLVDVENNAIVDANEKSRVMLGYSSEELRDVSISDIHPEEMKQLQSFANEVKERGISRTEDLTCRTKSGEFIPVEITATPMEIDNRKCMLVLAHDIRDRIKAERTLISAKELAERANDAKSTFLANASHELRTPLNAILGFSEILKSEMFGDLGSGRYRDYSGDIHSSATHLLALVNDLLDLSKIESGGYRLEETAVDVGELAQRMIRMLKSQAEPAGVELLSEIAADFPLIYADLHMIEQIVVNLVSNSIRFSRKGGQVTVSIKLAGDGDVLLHVRDTGHGIPEDDILKIADPFYQVESADKFTHPGTGLGLSIVKSLVQLHGGSLAIESELGRGTSVTARLPARRIIPPRAVGTPPV